MIVEFLIKVDIILKFLEKVLIRRYGKFFVYELIILEGILFIIVLKGYVYDFEIKKGLYGVEYYDGKFIFYYNFIKCCMKCNI